MVTRYVIGVLVGLLSGVLMQGGQILQKKAVNHLRAKPHRRFFFTLLKNPTWLAGFIIVGCGSASYALAQSLIGPALVPGLTAFGLVVLALGSVRMNGEELDRPEILGIGLMIVGVFCLGFSRLDIPMDQVHRTLADGQALVRIAIFSGILVLIFGILRSLVARIGSHRQGILIALGNGFLCCLNNFWITPLLAAVALFLGGERATPMQWTFFITAAVIVTVCGWVITWQSQQAFKVAQASNVVPVGQVPVQLAPIVVYFFVFALSAPGISSILYIISGTVLTIAAGFLLGRRQQTFVNQS